MAKKKKRKIALVGTASSGVQAPYGDKSWEIWGVSARADYVTRATRWFELHRLDGEPRDWANAWRATMKTFTSDVELLMFYPELDLGPKIRQYPTQRVTDRFGTYFMTSTFSWMIALAIDELRPLNGAPVEGELGFWGVDMEYGTEYREQRAGFRHFIEVAKILGIPVSRLASSGLVYDPVPYPLWQDDPLLNKLERRKAESDSRLKTFGETISHTRAMIAENAAVIKEIDAAREPGYDAEVRKKKLIRERAALVETSSLISKDIVYLEGAAAELSWARDYLTP
jgi:hypothetical protein